MSQLFYHCATTTVLLPLCYNLFATSTVLQTLCFKHCATTTVLLPLCYFHCATSTVLQALCFKHCATSTVLQALCYKHCATSTVLQALCYKHCATTTVLLPLCYTTGLKSGRIWVRWIFEFVKWFIAILELCSDHFSCWPGVSIRMLQWLDGARWPPKYFLKSFDELKNLTNSGPK